MSSNAALMGTAMGINAATSIGSSFAQSQALRMKGQFQSVVAGENARFADIAGSDALARGETAARLNMTRVRSVIGAQRASLAAQGVDVNRGSAAEVQEDTAGQGALDSMTIRNNAFREAMGYKVQALNFTSEGRFASLTAGAEARNTLLTGGMKALGYGAESAYWFNQ